MDDSHRLKLLLKEYIKNMINEDVLSLAHISTEMTFNQFLSNFSGLTLRQLQDKISYINLYLGNKYGMFTDYPEQTLQKLMGTISLYYFQRILWVKLAQIDKEIELAKTTTLKKLYDEYEQVEKEYYDKKMNVKVDFNGPEDKKRDALNQKMSLHRNMDEVLKNTQWGKFLQQKEKEKEDLRKKTLDTIITKKDVLPDKKDKISYKTYKTAEKLFYDVKSTPQANI